MLTCATGSLQVVPGLGLHRILLPCRHSHRGSHVMLFQQVPTLHHTDNSHETAHNTAREKETFAAVHHTEDTHFHRQHQPGPANTNQHSSTVSSMSSAAKVAKSFWVSIPGAGRTNVTKVSPIDDDEEDEGRQQVFAMSAAKTSPNSTASTVLVSPHSSSNGWQSSSVGTFPS